MSPRQGRLDWLVFLALGLMWGSSYLFIRFAVETMTPLTVVAGRLAIGSLLLVGVMLVAREPLPREARTYGHLAMMSVLNIVLPFSLITWAELTAPSSLAAILTATVPLFVMVIASMTLRDEPITLNRLVGLGIGFAGVVILMLPQGGETSTELLPLLALLGASVSYASGAVYARRNVSGLRPMVPAVFQVGFAFLISAGLALVLERPLELDIDARALFSVVWLGLLGSGLAYLAFFRLLRSWGATRTSMVAYVLPVVAIALGVMLAGETISLTVAVGTLLVIGGIALVNARFGQRRLLARAAAPEVEAG